jgi:hypothetical protein
MVRSREVPTARRDKGLRRGAGDIGPLKTKGYFRDFPHQDKDCRDGPHMKSPSIDDPTPTQLARGFLTDAEAYLRAAQKLDQSVEGIPSSPQYYLACHSIELILKAFILIKEGTEDEVREIRHDLLKAWERATELGLCPKDYRTGEIVTMLAPYIGRRDLSPCRSTASFARSLNASLGRLGRR